MKPGVPIRVPSEVPSPDAVRVDGRPRVPPDRRRDRSREHSRHAPVEHEHLAEAADHDVRRLEVAMDDAGRVRERDGLDDALEHREARGLAARATRRAAASVSPRTSFIT